MAAFVIGDNVKIQNNVSIYTGMTIEDDAFLGPSCVFTNVKNPRSQINRHALYERTVLKRGCTIGPTPRLSAELQWDAMHSSAPARW
jgi:bifunctional N-acetylglucosamine-1-phosphate-uridyltransferase/glucosamine-1-phosphate-acetyltransferase GlmU-like protein